MITLWGRGSAYNVQKVLWLMAELGLEFQHVDVGSLPGELESHEFLAMNPNARIPVIKVGDEVVWESNTILRYLASCFGAVQMYPIDLAARSRVDRWLDWELATWQPEFLMLFWRYYRTPEADRDEAEIGQLQRRCERPLTILHQQLTNNHYVAGEMFSLADICVGSAFYRYFNMGLLPFQSQPLQDWYQRLCQRPAYQQQIMVGFESLRGRLQF